MLAIPAIDLREGACVQLVGGSYSDERIRLSDPVAVAREWQHCGFAQLHVVDLDAATGRGNNAEVIRAILRDTSMRVQVGGGVRTTDQATEWLDHGAHAIVVGTRAIEEPEWLADLAVALPAAVVVAADVRDRNVVTHGWSRTSRLDILALAERLADLPLAGILVTAVHREGLMEGTDLQLMEDVVEAVGARVLASGGVAHRRDLDALAERGVAGAIIGMALYTGALDARLVAEEYGDE